MKTSRRTFLKQGVAGIGVSLLLSYAASPVSGSEKTNLLFIIADQYRSDAMSCAGASPLETPNLDRLAREGARFTKAYTHCPVCGPARTSMLTGRAFVHTATPSNRQALDKAHGPDSPLRLLRTFDEILTAQGYHAEFLESGIPQKCGGTVI